MDQLSGFHPDVLGSDEQFGHETVLFDPCPRVWRNPGRHWNDLFVVPAQCRTGAGHRRLPGSLGHHWWATVQGTGVENRFPRRLVVRFVHHLSTRLLVGHLEQLLERLCVYLDYFDRLLPDTDFVLDQQV